MAGLEPAGLLLERSRLPVNGHPFAMIYYKPYMDIIPKLNNKQLDRLSEFSSNTALLSVASLIIPNVFGIDRPNILELILGLVLTAAFLLISLTLINKRL